MKNKNVLSALERLAYHACRRVAIKVERERERGKERKVFRKKTA
jgi:hypothetical protein